MSEVHEERFTGPPQSYWLATAKPGDYPALEEEVAVDVGIIGGGIAGITCGYLLKEAGLSVAVIEADRLAGGATGHTTAKITSQHQLIYSKIKQAMGTEAAEQYADANETAIREIEELVNRLQIGCDFSRQNAYVYTKRDGYIKKLEEEAKLASSLGIRASVIDKINLPLDCKAALCYEGQAQFHPLKYVLTLAAKIPGRGSYVFEQSRIVDIDDEDKKESFVLKTADGRRVKAQKVVIATQYPCYNKAGLYFSRIYTERSYVVAVKTPEPYPGGMYITAEEPGRSFRFQPAEEGELVLVGGEHHKTGQGEDTRKHYAVLADYAAGTFSGAEVCYRWSTQDCMTLDGVPYVGHFLPSTPNLFLVTGFGKWGMTNSMASAMIVRDLIIKNESPWQYVYNPSRQTVAASAKTFVVENLNVAAELIKGKLNQADDNIEIKPGEGKVIMLNGQKTGAFRDEEGTLHLVDTTCTHLGCELSWNVAERSWDCPCHGSRFTCEGDIITGPAVKKLKKIERQD